MGTKKPFELKRIDHIGIAVRKIEEHLDFYRDVLHMEYLGEKVVSSQKVRVAMFKIGESVIELLEPTNPDSPISNFLVKRGEGIHHLCYDVDDIHTALAELSNKGISLINEKPVIGAKGVKISFLHPKSTKGILVELSES